MNLRNLHIFAVGCHLASLAFFAWVYTVIPSGIWMFFIGWSVFYGALSLAAIRKGKASG